MNHRGDGKARPGSKYRDLVPAFVLLTALTLLMVGVAAARLGLITVEIKIGLRLSAAAPKTTVAAPVAPPTPGRLAVSEGSSPVAAVAPETRLAALGAPTPAARTPRLIPTIVMAEAAVPPAAPATSVKAVAFTPRSKPPAPAVGKRTRVADCVTTATPANADPTMGEISGTTGLPDQVAYFKLREGTALCRAGARAVSSAR